MSKKNDPFKSVTIRSRKAKKFLEKLDETHERWGKGEVWVFRGQNDATWELKPSLFRDWDKDTYGSYEIALIDNFIRNANVANLPIPNNSLDYIDEGKPTLRTLQGEKGEITYDFSHPAFAIARHSGIPTRLLDFTYNSLIAAYFAANTDKLCEKLKLSSEIKAKYFDKCLRAFKNTDAIIEIIEKYLADPCVIKMTELPKNIAVWAIRVRDLKETSFQLLDHPYTQIMPLRSQMGVFLCDTDFDEEKVQKDKSWTSFNAKLAKLAKTKSIYKLTLSFSEISDLQILLAQKRIYPMFVKPSYEEVAKMTLARMALRIRSHKKSHRENKK